MRHHSHGLSVEHKQLKQEIRILREENTILKKRLQKMEDAIHEVYLSKKKYKARFKEIRQKYDILEKVYQVNGKGKRKDERSGQKGQYGLIMGHEEMAFGRQNFLNCGKRHNYTSKIHQKKQDLTSNTLHTMPSSQKSETKYFLRKSTNSRNLKESSTSQSKFKEAGKIFNIKGQEKQQLGHQSSGSEGEGNKRDTEHGQLRQLIWRQERDKSPVSRWNYETSSQEGRQGQQCLKNLIEHLISQLKSFSTLENEQQTQQKQVQFITAQNILSQKLQQMCQKLNLIQTNQQALIMRMSSSKEYHQAKMLIQGSSQDAKENKFGTNIVIGANQRMSASFLKTVEEIGRDLTQWKIDYVKGKGK